jgi:hypothetical protein
VSPLEILTNLAVYVLERDNSSDASMVVRSFIQKICLKVGKKSKQKVGENMFFSYLEGFQMNKKIIFGCSLK